MSQAGPSLGDGSGLDGLLAQVHAMRPGVGRSVDATPNADPVRLHYIEALTRRLQASSPAVQRVLRVKLEQALKALVCSGEAAPPVQFEADLPEGFKANPLDRAALSARSEQVEGAASTPAPRKPRPKVQAEVAPPSAPLSLLGQLNQHIQTASAQPDTVGKNSPPGLHQASLQDLKSALRFRETWARISAETEVDQAAHRAPENAGPLNAHNLVLRTLGLMRELSPDYLRRFMGHTESLMWLDQAYGQLKQTAGKAKTAKAAKVPKAKH